MANKGLGSPRLPHFTAETNPAYEPPDDVENLAHQLFTEITEMGFRLDKLEVRETDSSVVSYTREDWVADNRYFAQAQSPAVERPGGCDESAAG